MKKILTQVYLEPHHRKWLKKESKKSGLPMAELIRYWLDRVMQKLGEELEVSPYGKNPLD